MPDRDQTQINYVFAATALSVGMSLGVALSHAFWRMDYLLLVGSESESEKSAYSEEPHSGVSHSGQPELDFLAFREKIHVYDALESVLDASNRMGRLFDDVPDKAIPLAVELIDDIETRMAKRRAIEVLFTRWSEIEPEAAMNAASEMENRRSREAAQQAVLSVWLETAPDQAKQYIARSPDDRSRERLLRFAIGSLGDASPEQAIDLLMTSKNPIAVNRRLSKLGNTWGRIDPEAALGWARENLEKPDDRSQFVAEVIHGWALERPVEALEHVRTLSEQEQDQSQGLLIEVLRGWATEDPAAAVHYILKFDSKDEQLNLMRAISETLSNAESDKILSWASEFEGVQKAEILAQLIEAKLNEDPVAAANLAQQLPNGELQATVFGDLALSWANQDISGATEWLKSLSPSPERDSAAISFASAIFDGDSGVALDWAMSIGDSQMRSETLTRLLERWLLSNPTAAESWLAENSDALVR